MIFRHERASAVRIAVNSNTIIVMPGGARAEANGTDRPRPSISQ
jgi:hypothetical protein